MEKKPKNKSEHVLCFIAVWGHPLQVGLRRREAGNWKGNWGPGDGEGQGELIWDGARLSP